MVKMSARVLGSMLSARFQAFQDNGDHRIRQAGKMVILVAVVIGKNPRGHDLVQRTKEAMCGHGDGDVLTKYPSLLSFMDHALNEIEVFDHEVVRELAQELQAMAQ